MIKNRKKINIEMLRPMISLKKRDEWSWRERPSLAGRSRSSFVYGVVMIDEVVIKLGFFGESCKNRNYSDAS